MIWNMAALRQRQAPRRYKACGPVGEKLDAATPEMRERSKSSIARSIFLEAGHVSTCRDCGYHVCSCPAYATAYDHVMQSVATSLAHRMSILEGLQAMGMLDGADRNGAIRLLLTGDGAESLAARTQRYEAQLSCTRPPDDANGGEPGEGP